MARGRNASTNELAVLLEILLKRDRPLFSSEIDDVTPVGQERTRQVLDELADRDLVDIEKVSGRRLYTLTDEGFALLSHELRSLVHQKQSNQ